MKGFNTEGRCTSDDYMVDLSSRINKIRLLIKKGKYLYIQKGRQYGKTTLLKALAKYLKNEYAVIYMDFQGMGKNAFCDENNFVKAFIERLNLIIFSSPDNYVGLSFDSILEMKKKTQNGELDSINSLSTELINLCKQSQKKIILIIDEVDNASNNQVFLDFLALLRFNYINNDILTTFQSVILAGVYDIRYLKQKIRPENEHDNQNSPWNIASPLGFEMRFDPADIETMLLDYESEHKTGMNITAIAQNIYDYTSGHPYLVSSICKFIDEELNSESWNREGISTAVKNMLKNPNIPLFQSLVKEMVDFPEMERELKNLLFQGKEIDFNPYDKATSLGLMFGLLKEKEGKTVVANRIFEMLLTNFFISKASKDSKLYQVGAFDRNQFIDSGTLNMEKVLRKFTEYYGEVFSGKDEKYLETLGREIFLLFLKPIINGTGNYYLEAATRDMRRTNVVVDFNGMQFVIEMKIWHGDEYNKRGEKQLLDYLNYFKVDKGYMISFNFNRHKKTGVSEIIIKDKVIIEAVV